MSKIQFTNMECKRMLFNPHKVIEGKTVFDTFPTLKKYSIFKRSLGKGLDNNKVMMYIFCMYDMNTPYRIKYADVLKRKIEIAHDVGFATKEGGTFEDLTEHMLMGKNKTVNAKIAEYVRMHRHHKYTYLVAMETSYYKMLEDMQLGLNTDKKAVQEIRNIQEELEAAMSDILADDDNFLIKDTVLRYMEEERIGVRPEDIALKLSKNEYPFVNKELWR